MAVEIWKPDEKKEPTIRLKLEYGGSRIILRGYEENGNCWTLIEIPTDGKEWKRIGCVAQGVGLSLDTEGKVVIK